MRKTGAPILLCWKLFLTNVYSNFWNFFISKLWVTSASESTKVPTLMFLEVYGLFLWKALYTRIALRPLREKCPNTELFLVRIFPHSDWIRRDIQSKCRKIRTRNNCVFAHFSRSDILQRCQPGLCKSIHD